MKETHIMGREGETPLPRGGRTEALGIDIVWQNGARGQGDHRQPPNGAQVEDVIWAALGRLRWYQSTALRCEENAAAILGLEEALTALHLRTKNRTERGVEGTAAP